METMFSYIIDVIIIVACLWYLGSKQEVEWQEDLIERGYGQYCTDTGEFAFVGEC